MRTLPHAGHEPTIGARRDRDSDASLLVDKSSKCLHIHSFGSFREPIPAKEEETMRSDRVKKGLERAPARALLHATGLPKGEIDKPFIGIGNSSTDLVPGHLNLPELARFVEKGVHTGGGYPFLFNVGALCDGIAMGHKGMF